MNRLTCWLSGAALIGLLLPPLVSGAEDCTDLDAIDQQPAVDYENSIQPIFDNQCLACHGPGGQAGLDLSPGASHDNLVKVASSQDATWLRVTPSSLQHSLLFLKVNCNDPPVGSRMPPGGAMADGNQALIRDWIVQGALPEADLLFQDRFEN